MFWKCWWRISACSDAFWQLNFSRRRAPSQQHFKLSERLCWDLVQESWELRQIANPDLPQRFFSGRCLLPAKLTSKFGEGDASAPRTRKSVCWSLLYLFCRKTKDSPSGPSTNDFLKLHLLHIWGKLKLHSSAAFRFRTEFRAPHNAMSFSPTVCLL